MKRFDIITLFPETISPYSTTSILGKAQNNKLIDINAHQLRDFATGKHKQVDDTPYGGGAGMVMMIEPIAKALKKIKKKRANYRVIVTAASGERFTQQTAKRLAEYDQLIFICGRYEGIDQRVIDHLADESLSVGDYVLTGGELPALIMTDAISRLIPGVLGNNATLSEESHTIEGYLEYPHYTKPENYIHKTSLFKKEILSVPPVLLSGNHNEIEKWRQENSKHN
jgi:tRNA (guanine37-N1)-methyltransferase